MNFADFDALSFDCYGTLIDWEAGITAVFRRWADARGLAMSDEELLTAFSTHEAETEAVHPTALYPEILARSMRALGAQLGVPVSDQEAEAFGASVPDWPAFPDSQEALERLAKRYGLRQHREAYVAAMRAYNAGQVPRHMRTWTLPFLIRHSAFHTLDHAWEMEDKDMSAAISTRP